MKNEKKRGFWFIFFTIWTSIFLIIGIIANIYFMSNGLKFGGPIGGMIPLFIGVISFIISLVGLWIMVIKLLRKGYYIYVTGWTLLLFAVIFGKLFFYGEIIENGTIIFTIIIAVVNSIIFLPAFFTKLKNTEKNEINPSFTNLPNEPAKIQQFAQVIHSSGNKTIICTNCKTQYSINSKFCPNCGTSTKKENICEECGIIVEANTKFCPNCGKSIISSANQELNTNTADKKTDDKNIKENDTVNTPKNNRKLILIVGIAIVIVTSILAVIFLSGNSKSSCDKFLEGYEDYVNRTVEIVMKMEQNPSDMTIISEYTKLISESAKWMQISKDCENDAEFMRKFTDIQLRLATKMSKKDIKSMKSEPTKTEPSQAEKDSIANEERIKEEKQKLLDGLKSF